MAPPLGGGGPGFESQHSDHRVKRGFKRSGLKIRKFFRLKKKREFALIVIIICTLILLGGIFLLVKKPFRAEVGGEKLIKINNAHNWIAPSATDTDLQEKIRMLAKRDNIQMTESYARISGITPAAIKAINPNAKVYLWYDLMNKNDWESDVNTSDWSCKDDSNQLGIPLGCRQITDNNWWLRDGDGNIIYEYGTENSYHVRFLDVGKPGYKEAFLAGTLNRLNGKGYDGVIFDYWFPYIYDILGMNGRQLHPPAQYQTDMLWHDNAWEPFISYLTNGLRQNKIKVIGNSAGEYLTTRPYRQIDRNYLDGVIYEQGAVNYWCCGQDFSSSSPAWLSGYTLERRINALRNDPLDVWQADNGITYNMAGTYPNSGTQGFDTALYDQRQKVSLAMYLVGLPDNQNLRDKRSYSNAFNWSVYWHSLWDINLGNVINPAEKMADKFFWSRKFSGGIVLLNYDTVSIDYVLDKEYVDLSGNRFSGTITLPEHTALILENYTAPPARSVKLNSYNNWSLTASPDRLDAGKLEAGLKILARHDVAVWSESNEQDNLIPLWDKLSSASLKLLNPEIRTFAYYHAGGKGNWEGDWGASSTTFEDNMTMLEPIPWYEIEANNWWLRDGAGNIVKNSYENNNVWYLDLGKPGFKEAFAEKLLRRLADRGFEGVVLDYLPMSIQDNYFAEPGGYFNSNPMPDAYLTDEIWYSDAYQPFVNYVFDALRDENYKVVGGGVSSQTVDPKEQFARSKIDITINEFWAVDAIGNWRPAERINANINDFINDPLEYWIADFSLKSTVPDYEKKANVGLAMYYIGLPAGAARSFNYVGNSSVFWSPAFDFNIGAPQELATKSADKYFWSRKYTDGLVLLNYENFANDYTLTQDYVDLSGSRFSGTISLAEHSALILKVDSGAGGAGSPSPQVSPTLSPQTSPTSSPTSRATISPEISPSVLSPSPTPAAFLTATPTQEIVEQSPSPTPEAVEIPFRPAPPVISRVSPTPILSPSATSSPSSNVIPPPETGANISPSPSSSPSGERFFQKIKGFVSRNPLGSIVILLLILLIPAVTYFFLKDKIRKIFERGDDEVGIQ